MGWIDIRQGGISHIILFTVRYDGNLPGLYHSLMEGLPNKVFQGPD